MQLAGNLSSKVLLVFDIQIRGISKKNYPGIYPGHNFCQDPGPRHSVMVCRKNWEICLQNNSNVFKMWKTGKMFKDLDKLESGSDKTIFIEVISVTEGKLNGQCSTAGNYLRYILDEKWIIDSGCSQERKRPNSFKDTLKYKNQGFALVLLVRFQIECYV